MSILCVQAVYGRQVIALSFAARTSFCPIQIATLKSAAARRVAQVPKCRQLHLITAAVGRILHLAPWRVRAA